MNLTADELLRYRITSGAICGLCLRDLPPEGPHAAGSFRNQNGGESPYCLCKSCNVTEAKSEAECRVLLRPLCLALMPVQGNA